MDASQGAGLGQLPAAGEVWAGASGTLCGAVRRAPLRGRARAPGGRGYSLAARRLPRRCVLEAELASVPRQQATQGRIRSRRDEIGTDSFTLV